MNKRYLLGLLIFGFTTSPLLQANAIDKSNWMTHPKIVEIRNIYQSVEDKINSQQLTKKSSALECERIPGYQADIHFGTDKIVRKYKISGGSGDSVAEVNYYYDAQGKQRFRFTDVAAVNGTHQQTRDYFDAAGKRLYQDRRLLEGPGWPWSYDELIDNPHDHFTNFCK